MNLLDVFSNQGWQDLVGALLHTIWQGALLALLIAFILKRIPAHHSDVRYIGALAAQISILLGGLLTWSILDYGNERPHREGGIDGTSRPWHHVTWRYPSPTRRRRREATR